MSGEEDLMIAGKAVREGSPLRQTNRPPDVFPDGLACPGCQATVNWNGREVCRCGCGRNVAVHGGRLPDFIAGADPVADGILGWSDAFIQEAEPSLLALASGQTVNPAVSEQLEAKQLLKTREPANAHPVQTKSWRLDRGSPFTALGSNLAYHCMEFSLQAVGDQTGRFLDRLTRLTSLGADASVVDVGCGAGQTLRLLGRLGPAERIGLDIDPEALAFGCRLAETHGEAIHFVRGSASCIPFRADRFSHVISRVALNYVHQRRALREMVRVLRPGGFLYCTLEGPGFDLQFLQQSRTAAQVLCRLRDLFYGLTLALTSVQPMPGSRWSGGRAFGTRRRCTQVLSRAGCRVVHAEASARHLGMPTVLELVAQKCETTEL
jgi:SAM-dependent methyltransferase